MLRDTRIWKFSVPEPAQRGLGDFANIVGSAPEKT